MLMMEKLKKLEFEPVHTKNVLLASVVHGISCLLFSGFLPQRVLLVHRTSHSLSNQSFLGHFYMYLYFYTLPPMVFSINPILVGTMTEYVLFKNKFKDNLQSEINI
jgi:hypothetical protein